MLSKLEVRLLTPLRRLLKPPSADASIAKLRGCASSLTLSISRQELTRSTSMLIGCWSRWTKTVVASLWPLSKEHILSGSATQSLPSLPFFWLVDLVAEHCTSQVKLSWLLSLLSAVSVFTIAGTFYHSAWSSLSLETSNCPKAVSPGSIFLRSVSMLLQGSLPAPSSSTWR